MTLIIALLSEYVVATIEDASNSWGLSISFLSIILLPIVGNATKYAGAIIFAFKIKLDITLDVALESAAQIAMFVDKTNGWNEECCSYTSSNRESWGRCSSLGGTDKESFVACTAASNGHQSAMTTRSIMQLDLT
ncbi:hypothetical protein F2P56_013024 [Juglans regia]|uniref:Vacuolar cation/proton exchanger 3-like n=1 Tax=Juglans regia TaxID=51240 RepID=A0A833XPX9_JUGRE|nr:hypothetical protein F2P56_013024 [Juglans regia]